MRFGFYLAALAVCAASPSLASAQRSTSPAVAVQSASLPGQLAQELYSKEIFPAFQPNFGTELEKSFRASADGTKMERLFPGFVHKFALEAVPEIRAQIISSLPALYDKVAAVYGQQLTPQEQQQLLEFARSPAGHALRKAVGQSYDIQSLAQSVARDGKISDEAAEQQRQLVAMGLRQNISDADAAEIKRFVQTPIGKKAAELDKQMRPMLLEFSNNLDTPAAGKRMNGIALRVARDMARRHK